MAVQFLTRNIGWFLHRSRAGTKAFRYVKPFQNFSSIRRPFLTASSVEIDGVSKRLIVKWKDNFKDEYPLMWLRDNCQCPACFDQSSQSRTINFSKFMLDPKSKSSVRYQ